MTKLSDWLPLDEIKDLNGIKCIHTDTRFYKLHTLLRSEPFDVESMKREMSDNKWYKEHYSLLVNIFEGNEECNEEYIIKQEDILPFLQRMKAIKEESQQIMLRFEVKYCDFWLKYIRIYRIGDTNDFVVTNDGRPIEWRKLNEKNVLKFL